MRLFLDAGMGRAVGGEIETWKPDVLHVTLARMAPYMPARAAFAAEARLMLAYEARVAASADSCSVVSGVERAMPGLERAAVIPNGVDVEAFPFAPAQEREPVLVFFGNLGYFHNVEPAKFLAERVLPLVRARVAGAQLRLVGARPAAAVRRLAELDGVELAADVPSKESTEP